MAMDRRNFLSTAAVTLAAAATSPAQTAAPRARPASQRNSSRRPKNVVLMICDDLGYGDLACYGSKIPTPHLDRMAAEGMRFTRCNAGHPICSASRAALLTGRYAQRSHTKGAYFPHAKTGMDLDETTLANMFHGHGYRTKAIGKWHLGDAPEYLPTSRGFDSYLGVPYSDDMAPLPLIRDTDVVEPETDRDLLTQRYTQEAVDFLEQTPAAQPFFLYMAFSYPHDPARASQAFRGRSGLGEYGDAVHEIDWSVGRVSQTLAKKGLLDDTLILFTSDHGPWYQGSPANLRGRKGTTFEGGFRVPLIAQWRPGIAAGFVQDEWASNMDVLPTLAALCGLKLPSKPLDGLNISDLLLGHQDKLDRKAVLYFTPVSSGGLDLHCARKGSWKMRFAQLNGEIYILDYTVGHDSFLLPRAELYNLDADPSECFNVAKEHPDIVKAISTEVVEEIKTMPPDVIEAFARLRHNVAHPTTPPAAAPRPQTWPHLDWAWEPEDRRSLSPPPPLYT